MVNVVCMKWGTKYGPVYVNNLFRGVSRCLERAHRFVCFTDDRSGLLPEIETLPLPLPGLSGHDIASAWNKLGIFRSPLFDLEGPTLFLDIDLIVTGSLDPFFDYETERFVIINDWQHPKSYVGNSSVFRFEAGKYGAVLDNYLEKQEWIKTHHRNEQEYLSHFWHERGEIAYWPPHWCASFKRHCLPDWPKMYWRVPSLPSDARVVVFHGTPNPPEALRGLWSKGRLIRPSRWIARYWDESLEG